MHADVNCFLIINCVLSSGEAVAEDRKKWQKKVRLLFSRLYSKRKTLQVKQRMAYWNARQRNLLVMPLKIVQPHNRLSTGGHLIFALVRYTELRPTLAFHTFRQSHHVLAKFCSKTYGWLNIMLWESCWISCKRFVVQIIHMKNREWK